MSNAKPAMSMTTLRIVWGAILLSVVTVAVVAVITTPQRPPPSEDIAVLQLALPFVALSTTLAMLVVPRVIASKAAPHPTEQQLAQRYQLICILRWALAESVAMYGFVLAFLGGSGVVAGALMAAGGVLVLVQPPSERGREGLRAL